MNLKSLISNITKKLGWHPERSLTFTSLILGLIQQGSVHHHRMCLGFEKTPPSLKSHLERVRRFFKNQAIDPLKLSHTLLMTVLHKIPKMDLILDRTNWKFGKTDINYLVLAVRIYGKVVFPLGWRVLDHQGNSDAEQRISLLNDFQSIFGFDRIRSFAADREFIGTSWIQYLCQHNIPFLSAFATI